MKFTLSPEALQKTMKKDISACDVLYITECSLWGKIGYEKVAAIFPSVFPVFWSSFMPKPDLSNWRGDWIISFKSDLILSRDLLQKAKKGAINFHPSPPQYRGLGGYWWALHNGDKAFGVTCHHMNERIDYGDIISTESFPILSGETVESLKHKAAIHSLALLSETLQDIVSHRPLKTSREKWEQHLYTSKELALAQSIYAISGNRRLMRPVFSSRDVRRAFGNMDSAQYSMNDLREERGKELRTG